MRIIADENFDYGVYGLLRSRGFEIEHISDIMPSADDLSVLEYTNKYSAMILTEDKDFGELVYRLRLTHIGVILVRLSGLTSTQKFNIILKNLDEHLDDMAGSFTVIAENKTRIKKVHHF